MLHTIVVAGAPRRREWFGIRLKYREVFMRSRVMDALIAVDEKYPGVGKSMLPTFSPNGASGAEAEWVHEAHISVTKLPEPSPSQATSMSK